MPTIPASVGTDRALAPSQARVQTILCHSSKLPRSEVLAV